MLVNRVPTLLNPSQVGVKFIDVMGVCHWSLLTQELSTLGCGGPATPSALHFLRHDMVKKTSLCWALYSDICTTNRNCNTSEISISIFMSVTLTYSRSYAVVVQPPLNSAVRCSALVTASATSST